MMQLRSLKGQKFSGTAPHCGGKPFLVLLNVWQHLTRQIVLSNDRNISGFAHLAVPEHHATVDCRRRQTSEHSIDASM